MEDFKVKYHRLESAVKKMIDADNTYHKTKDPKFLRLKMVWQKEVKKIMDPAPISQATFEWLAQ